MKREIDQFEQAYEAFFNARKSLEKSDNGMVFEPRYKEYDLRLTSVVEHFYIVLVEFDLDFNQVIEDELKSLIDINFRGRFQEQMHADFLKEYYSSMGLRLLFYNKIIEDKIPERDLTALIVEIGQLMLAKEGLGMIRVVLEMLSQFSNPKGIVLVEAVVKELERDNDFYEGGIGVNIMVYLDSLKSKEAYDFIVLNQNIDIEQLNDISS